ncbi:MAG: peptidylprolyl isomerase [Pseudohongiella sp.]|uniref:peptidylprolyl isomerase n=1 Tax=Pseudohongiella sp. TaxID=1979412 RepID=UPI0034A01868
MTEQAAETAADTAETVAEAAADVADDISEELEGNPVVVMETSMGSIEIELWADRAPISVENFLRYTDNNLYDNLTFHRVIPGFMIQGGGYDSDFVEMSGYAPITNEADPELQNDRGTLAMARTNVVDSATSQFFINLVDNDFLNQTGTTPQQFGYAVFGEVISGMDVVDQIATVETANRNQHQNVPVEPVIIESVTRR